MNTSNNDNSSPITNKFCQPSNVFVGKNFVRFMTRIMSTIEFRNMAELFDIIWRQTGWFGHSVFTCSAEGAGFNPGSLEQSTQFSSVVRIPGSARSLDPHQESCILLVDLNEQYSS